MQERDDYEELVHGEHPPNLDQIPGTRQIDDVPNPSRLEEITNKHLEENPDIVEFASKEEKDVIAKSTGRGKIIFIGTGVAALLTGAAILIYKHKKDSAKDVSGQSEILE